MFCDVQCYSIMYSIMLLFYDVVLFLILIYYYRYVDLYLTIWGRCITA